MASAVNAYCWVENHCINHFECSSFVRYVFFYCFLGMVNYDDGNGIFYKLHIDVLVYFQILSFSSLNNFEGYLRFESSISTPLAKDRFILTKNSKSQNIGDIFMISTKKSAKQKESFHYKGSHDHVVSIATIFGFS